MDIVVRPLTAADLPAAAAINRAAFSAFFGIPDPAKFRPGADVTGLRWRLWPEGARALEVDGNLAAAALMMRWGSIAIIGPVVVTPEHWSKGLARTVMPELIAEIDRGGFAFAALLTHPQSTKHVRLYESFGFRMQKITGVMTKPVAAAAMPGGAALYSDLDEAGRRAALGSIRSLTDSVFPGLDVCAEVDDLARHAIGETLLLSSGGELDAMALCHHGTESEASDGQMFVKFAAARGGRKGARRFRDLLAACEALAARRGAALLVAGTSSGRSEAYDAMHAAGFRTIMNGIAMMRPVTDGYNRPGIFVIDDWR
jgi:GNAT superfamily N-acetyltransferase